jgi:hypothetical protein
MKFSTTNITLSFVIVSLFFQSCGGIKPSAPVTANQTIEKKALPPISSTINIPIKVEMKPFLKLADDAFDKEFKGSDKPCSGLRYDYKVQRQPLKVTGKGKTLFLDLNMAYGFRGEYCAACIMETCINPPIPFSCGWNESLRRVNVKLSSDIDILSNYRIKSVSKFLELNTIDPCAITFANININNVLLDQLKPQLGSFAKMIDQEVAKQDLKPYVLPVWKALQEDIKIDQVGYLRFQPQQLSLGELAMNGSLLTFSIGLKAAPVITPESQSKPVTALPNLSAYQKGNGFEVYTDLAMNYDSLSKQVFSTIQNESFALGKEKIRVTYMKLFPANEKLGVEVGFTGTKKGVFYLLGNPEFDSKTGHLKLKNVEYDIATKNVLIKSAKWLLDETIRKKLEEQMDFDMSALVQDTKKSINESLNQKMDYGVQLKGLLTSLDIVGWDINSKNLVVRSKIKGDLQVVIN